MIRGKKYYISISMRKSSCISRQVLTGPTHQAPRSLTPGRKRYGTFLCPVNNTQGRATGSQRKERGERLTFLTNCGGLGKGQVRECLQRNPDRKKKEKSRCYKGGPNLSRWIRNIRLGESEVAAGTFGEGLPSGRFNNKLHARDENK